MTRQEMIQISERIRDHLIQQNAQAILEDVGCVYRHENGNKCAVGCLLTEDAYTSDMEEHDVYSEIVKRVVNESLGFELTRLGIEVLGGWQRYHDNRYTSVGDDGPAAFHDRMVSILNEANTDDLVLDILEYV